MNKGFIERSIMGALTFLKDSVYADEYASRPGFLQSCGPRVKMIAVFLLVITVLLAKDVRVLLFLYGLCLALAWASKIKLKYFLERTWIFIPLFTVLVVIPAIFDFFTPGRALYSVHIGGLHAAITQEGLSGAILLIMRVATSVSFVILLSLTTRHSELLKALRSLGVPQLFVMVLGMCYRYIYLFVEVIEHTYMAVKSRVGGRVHHKKGRNIVAWNMGALWMRSYQLNEQVYKAMLSRGYRGEEKYDADI
jgi:cobalt/nickel transport system permease protein